MKIAFIPWDKSIKGDNIFIPKNEEYLDSHIILSKELHKLGYEIHTIDMYNNLDEVDCFLFSKLDYKWLNIIIKKHLLHLAVYCSAEPAVVVPLNSREGYKYLLRIFSNVLTWDDDLVDNNHVFKRNIPYYFVNHIENVPFKEKKLLTNISGNKKSVHPNELYSERAKVISWFEKNHPNEFDLYGYGWNVKQHPSYIGCIDSKFEVYHKYKFALCLENMCDVKGYITEKICDCICAGIVPIYYGASNITEYIPQNCFIDYASFGSVAELRQFLISMTETQYNVYLTALSSYLNEHNNEPFSERVLSMCIANVIQNGDHAQHNLGICLKTSLRLKELKNDVNVIMLNARIKLAKKLSKVEHEKC